MGQLPLEVVLAMEVSGTRTTVTEWLGMVQRVRELIVCEKVHDALVLVKALEDGMTEYLDEDKHKDQHYFNRPATSSNERIEGGEDPGSERSEGDEDHEHHEGDECDDRQGDECDDRPQKRQRQ